MAGLLSNAGHKLVDDLRKAELVLFNTCTVKDRPEKRFFSELKKVLALKKKVVVAGCITQADPYNDLLKSISVVGVRNLDKVVEVVSETSKGKMVRLLDFKDNPRLNLPKIRKNPVVEIIPIAAGCLGECSYCKTRLARGRLFSYDARAIKQQFENAVNAGIKEVWLTSQDCGAYGKDIGSSLPELLNLLLETKGDYKVRLGMINPNHAMEFLDELITILKHPNMFKFVHLPVQSGSNSVLKVMNRKYKAEDFVMIVKKLRRAIPMVTIATDVIAGFPSESDSDFEQTLDLLSELRIPVVNITKFCPRKGTPAFKLPKLNTRIVKKRCKQLVDLQAKIIDNKEWLGWQGKIIIDEIGRRIGRSKNGSDCSVVGRNDFYKPVVVKNSKLKLGSLVNVRISGVMQNYLEANLV
jgi:threonylcarbamoyladenosine tRNA methylthiotransferase CDKAL1